MVGNISLPLLGSFFFLFFLGINGQLQILKLLTRDDGSSEVPESYYVQEPLVSSIVLLVLLKLKFSIKIKNK